MNKKPVVYQGNLDKRIIQKRILCGEIKAADLAGYLETLPDVAENAEEIAVTQEAKK